MLKFISKEPSNNSLIVYWPFVMNCYCKQVMLYSNIRVFLGHPVRFHSFSLGTFSLVFSAKYPQEMYLALNGAKYIQYTYLVTNMFCRKIR